MLKKGEQNKKLQQDVQALRAKLDKKLYLAQKCKRLQSKVTKQNETLANLKRVNQQISRRLDSCRAALSAEKAKGAAKVSEVELLSKRKIKDTLQYAQGKIQQTKSSSSVLAQKLRKKAGGVKKNLKDQGVKLSSVQGEVRSLKKVISSLDSERAELEETMEIKIEERMQDFLKSQEVVAFQGGMYVDAVRALYMDLMGMNVGARNCESVVRCVMNKLAGNIKLGRLPKATFGKTMIIEGRAQEQQIVDKMLSPVGESITLCTDGTTKWGYTVSMELLMLCLRMVLASQLRGLRDMVEGRGRRNSADPPGHPEGCFKH
ncbi:hypothetical protein HOLleu_14931 [Holothuria leucospilota]|uniref:Uncharacterized protein n=1 Tax=Holothuria leucospilota TaxID=206669 RepID=A0A9Q1C921_HOLLE|nr:hypothetical protein HOLleu_14931 [Holothuria leucospilota]